MVIEVLMLILRVIEKGIYANETKNKKKRKS